MNHQVYIYFLPSPNKTALGNTSPERGLHLEDEQLDGWRPRWQSQRHLGGDEEGTGRPMGGFFGGEKVGGLPKKR